MYKTRIHKKRNHKNSVQNAANKLLAAFSMLTIAGFLQAADAKNFQIERQPLDEALKTFAVQADLEVFARADLVASKLTGGVIGTLEPMAALNQLLSNTGLTWRINKHNTILIETAPTGPLEKEKTRPEVIEEMVVTATKRETGLQDTAMSIPALGERRLESMGADSFADFVKTVPGLTFADFGPNETNFTIRGVATGVQTYNVQATVGMYIDDLPSMDSANALSTPDLRLFDVNRIEVLRGPQGTLFGSGSMGGAVRVITNKPDTSKFAGKADVNLSTTRGGEPSYAFNSMLNLPVIEDQLAVRLVGYYRDNGGWVDNLTLGEDRNDEKARGGRIMVKYLPTENFTITGTVLHQNSEPEGSTAFNTTVNGNLARDSEVSEFVSDELSVYNIVMEYDFDGMQFRSSTSYADKAVLLNRDGGGGSYQVWDDSSDNFVQEIHLFSDNDSRFSWFAGAFYRKQSNRVYDFSWIIPGAEELYGTGPAGAEGDDVFSWILRNATSEKALFGELSYLLTDQLEATVGIRYFRNTRDDELTAQGFFNGGLTVDALSATESKSTFKFLLSYTLNDAAMMYIQASEGYRVGGINLPVPDPTPSSYAPDSLWNYEIGAKTSWLDNRLQLNGAIYYIDWQDQQLTQSTANGWAFLGNAGSSRSMGAELEIEAQLTANLHYTGAVTWTDAEIRVDSPELGARTGDAIPGVADFVIANALQYDFPISDQVPGFMRVDHQYIGESLSNFNPDISASMGGYHVANMRIGAYFNSWEISLFGNNLFNDQSVVAAVTTFTDLRYRLQPRTIGLNFRTSF